MIFETNPKNIEYLDITSDEFTIKFQLTEKVTVTWGYDATKSVVIPRGFYTNFASVPVFFRNFVPNVACNNSVTLWHDYMYYMKDHVISRSEADRVLRDASILKGIPRYKAWLMWVAVRLFAGNYWS